jgi:hypothetical protein
MKQNKLCLAIIFLVSVNFSYGQKTEINFNTYSGLFSFRGNGSASISSIGWGQFSIPIGTSTENPYGNKNDFSYAFELQIQKISKGMNIYGIGLGFENLKSQVHIDTYIESGFVYYKYAANGKTILKNTFITVNPFMGHRFSFRKTSFDMLAGIDLAYCLKSTEFGYIDVNNTNPFQNELAKPTIDFRPRIQIKTQIKKFGFLAGYSFGLTNFQTNNNLNANTSFLRMGLSYQIK